VIAALMLECRRLLKRLCAVGGSQVPAGSPTGVGLVRGAGKHAVIPARTAWRCYRSGRRP
jgi:hypothetical protein